MSAGDHLEVSGIAGLYLAFWEPPGHEAGGNTGTESTHTKVRLAGHILLQRGLQIGLLSNAAGLCDAFSRGHSVCVRRRRVCHEYLLS